MEAVFILMLVLLVLSVLYVIMFHVREGRDERGGFILNKAYSLAYYVLISLLLLSLFLFNWSNPQTIFSLTLKDMMVMMMCLSGITAVTTILVLKKKY
jgi:hypothetical protein